MGIPVEPRRLTADERGVMAHILRADFPGAAEFRGQLDHARVVALWAVDSPSVDLEVAGAVARAPVPTGVLPVTATVTSENGEIVGEILLWAEAGMLAGVEYAWHTDEPPTSLPPVQRIVISTQGSY